MFSPRNVESPNPFRPAVQYLLSLRQSSRSPRRNSSSIDSERKSNTLTMPSSESGPSTESRRQSTASTTHPTSPPRRHQKHQSLTKSLYATSDTDSDDWGDKYTPSSRLYSSAHNVKLTGWRLALYGGGVGQFLFTTSPGAHIYVGILVLWLAGSEIGLTILNRIILWSAYLSENYTAHTKLMSLIAGVYKFPYPLTTALFELCVAHVLLVVGAYLTRWLAPWLRSSGLGRIVAPFAPLSSSSNLARQEKRPGLLRKLAYVTGLGAGGIAGGGLFEFELSTIKLVLPLALIFTSKLLLSTVSFAYAPIGLYLCFRIGIVPLALAFTASITSHSHSIPTIVSSLLATSFLLAAILRTDYRFSWESMVAGVLSAIFVAYLPISFQNTYKSLLDALIPQGELLSSPLPSSPASSPSTPPSSRATWRLLHYTSLLSILITLPAVLLSGEVQNIYRNCYVLDVFFHWEMILFAGIGTWAALLGTVALTLAAGPLTTAFLFVPCSAILVPVFTRGLLELFGWAALVACMACCAWFAWVRGKEGRREGFR